jgi:copper chaperone CopZ
VSLWDWAWIALLVGLLLNAFWQQHRGHTCECCSNSNEHHHEHHAHHHDGHAQTAALSDEKEVEESLTLYKISGMNCNHCRTNVEKAIRSVEGVADVVVDLAGGKAMVKGAHDSAALIDRVKNYGYDATLQ